MQDSLQIFNAKSGSLSARVELPDGSTRHLHSTVEPETEAKYFQDIRFWGDVVVLVGLGLGYHLNDRISSIADDTIIIAVDYYDALVDHWAKTILHNRSKAALTFSAITWARGQDRLQEQLAAKSHPSIQVIKHPASYSIHREFYEQVLLTILPLAGHNPRRKEHSCKAMLLQGSFFLQEEMRRALEETCGVSPAVFRYENVSSAVEYESALDEALQREKPDFVVSINMKGFDGNGCLGEAVTRLGIPLGVWFVDDPHPILLQQRSFVSPSMTAFCWERAFLPFLKSVGFDSATYLPLATDPSLFSPETSSQDDEVRLGFVGSAMGESFLEEIRSRFLWSPHLQPLVDLASDLLLQNPAESIHKLATRASTETDTTVPFADDRNLTWLCSLVIHTASMKKRQSTVRHLMQSGVETFGDPEGWVGLVGPDIPTHPDMDYNTQLCAAYRRIAVNLNITSCQMPTAVNQRVFDVPASGGFILSDAQSDLGDLFEIGKEAICYHSIEDLSELIVRFGEDTGARRKISTAAHRRVLDQHTYAHRARAIAAALTRG